MYSVTIIKVTEICLDSREWMICEIFQSLKTEIHIVWGVAVYWWCLDHVVQEAGSVGRNESPEYCASRIFELIFRGEFSGVQCHQFQEPCCSQVAGGLFALLASEATPVPRSRPQWGLSARLGRHTQGQAAPLWCRSTASPLVMPRSQWYFRSDNNFRSLLIHFWIS